jgi:hypothetical protein
MPRQTHADTLLRWKRLIDSPIDGTDEAEEIEPFRARLEEMYRRAAELAQKKAELDAARQAATRELNEILENGSRTASWIRHWIREHLGSRNEKLVAFDIKPFRGRPRKKPSSQE